MAGLGRHGVQLSAKFRIAEAEELSAFCRAWGVSVGAYVRAASLSAVRQGVSLSELLTALGASTAARSMEV
jgi:hypothetical protein